MKDTSGNCGSLIISDNYQLLISFDNSWPLKNTITIKVVASQNYFWTVFTFIISFFVPTLYPKQNHSKFYTMRCVPFPCGGVRTHNLLFLKRPWWPQLCRCFALCNVKLQVLELQNVEKIPKRFNLSEPYSQSPPHTLVRCPPQVLGDSQVVLG
jgi:hypothetical protein